MLEGALYAIGLVYRVRVGEGEGLVRYRGASVTTFMIHAPSYMMRLAVQAQMRRQELNSLLSGCLPTDRVVNL